MSQPMTTSKPTEEFDEYAESYNEALGKALAASGEGRDYFAEGRVAWVARCLAELGLQPRAVLDFGCGDGFTAPMLRDALKAPFVIGIDVSAKSIAVARETYGTRASDSFVGRIITFERIGSFKPAGEIDVAYCNGVFHHIPPGAERDKAVGLVRDALKPGGLFAFWENNPWNPATRYVMSRCEFDKDAQMLTPRTARKLLAKNGFEILRTNYRFIFPRSLRMFRRLEDFVFRTPLGTQYMVLARKLA
jgi:SAM-dependent methyltransferase